ncbi:MAG: hypothetical protein ACRD29_04230 [Acidimicrobiales bacterium]
MPLLRTDDVVRRQRAIWLGPPGHRWPFDATYVAWAVGTAATAVCVGLGVVLGVVLGGRTLWPLGLLAGAVAAWVATRALLGVVDHDRPLRYWRQAAADELKGRRLVEAPTAARVDLRWRRVAS